MQSIGEITFMNDAIEWNIENIGIMLELYGCLWSPKFNCLDGENHLSIRKKSNTLILIQFNSYFPTSNDLYVNFQIRLRNIVSKLHGIIYRQGSRVSSACIDFTKISKDFTTLPDSFTVLCWLTERKILNWGCRERNGSDVLPYELRSNTASENETLEEVETISKSNNAPEKGTSEEVEANSKGEAAAKKPEDAAKDLREVETDSDYESFKKLQKDFEKLLLNGEDSDVTLEVQGIEFPAHRNILRARSPVFNAMFKHKMEETNSDVVTIVDNDPETFPDFLKYLYTGSTKHVNQENVCELYTISDKYEVMELKAKCAEFMKRHMSVEKFCEYFSLAHLHIEEELIRSAIEFFSTHTIEIVKTAKWQIFLQENSTIGNELFLKALTIRNNI